MSAGEKPAGEVPGPALSQSTLDALACAIGREGLVEVIGELRAEAPTLVAGLRVAASNADLRAMRHFAHTMKSNAHLLGAEALAVRCAELERLAIAGATGPATPLATTVAGQFEAMLQELVRTRT